MRRRSRHGSHSRWLTEQVRWEIARHSPKTARTKAVFDSVRDSWDRSPFVWSSGVHVAVFAFAWTAGAVTLFPPIPAFDVDDPAAVITAAWQVLAGFASIALAGLAVLMQLTSEPVVTSRGVRQVLFQESQFRPVLAFSIVGAVQVGIAALFLDHPGSAIVEVAVVCTTILWIGLSYARVGQVYAEPGAALRLGEKALVIDLKKSMREAHTRAVAEERLHTLTPREWRWNSTAAIDGAVLVTADRAGALVDFDIDLLTDITNDIADDDSSSFTASTTFNAPGEPSTANHPELRVMASIGSSIEAGQEIFILKNSESYSGDLAKLQGRLSKSIRWDEHP